MADEHKRIALKVHSHVVMFHLLKELSVSLVVNIPYATSLFKSTPNRALGNVAFGSIDINFLFPSHQRDRPLNHSNINLGLIACLVRHDKPSRKLFVQLIIRTLDKRPILQFRVRDLVDVLDTVIVTSEVVGAQPGNLHGPLL